MRAAPAVGVEIAGAASWRWALRGLLGLSLLVTVVWAWQRPSLKASGVADAGGDKAFDEEDAGCATPAASVPIRVEMG